MEMIIGAAILLVGIFIGAGLYGAGIKAGE